MVPWIPGFQKLFQDPETGRVEPQHIYPLAGTRCIGNFQSKAPPPFISAQVVEINKKIRLDDDSTPLTAGASQGYQESKAKFRHGAHLHALAQGTVTAYSAAQGGFVTLATPRVIKSINERIDAKMPFTVFRDQIEDLSTQGNRGVRFETNYEVFRTDIEPAHWNAK